MYGFGRIKSDIKCLGFDYFVHLIYSAEVIVDNGLETSRSPKDLMPLIKNGG